MFRLLRSSVFWKEAWLAWGSLGEGVISLTRPAARTFAGGSVTSRLSMDVSSSSLLEDMSLASSSHPWGLKESVQWAISACYDSALTLVPALLMSRALDKQRQCQAPRVRKADERW